MAILAEDFVYVVGVDTHAQTHTAAVVDRTGAVLCRVPAIRPIRPGWSGWSSAARGAASGARLWAVEQTGSYGAGLTALLGALGETGGRDRSPRPPGAPARQGRRPRRRSGRRARPSAARIWQARALAGLARPCGSSWPRDAPALAARTAAICQLKALVVTAPSALRQSLRGLPRAELVRTCSRLHLMQRHDEERRAAVLALRATARRIEYLAEEADHLEAELNAPGEGALSAATRATPGSG